MDQKSPAGMNNAGTNEPIWGSDLIAAALQETGIPYVCLNPGASYRGLHDSIVNYLGNENPQMIVHLHEEHAVAMAQGYAKVTERPLIAILHSNVGLMHGTMAIFNAWCDRMPMVVIGATGPVDAAKRRPYIDWIHTSADQGALVRGYTKWDDQPGSAEAAVESIRRGVQIACTPPFGPVYINMDAAVQEGEVAEWPVLNDISRYRPPSAPGAPKELVEQAAEMLLAAKNPLILAGAVSRNEQDWANRVQLAEALEAKVVSSTGYSAAFPTAHPLHVGMAGFNPGGRIKEAHREADVVISLDWRDLGGTLKSAWDGGIVEPKIIHCSMDFQVHGGWSMDYEALPPVEIQIPTVPDRAVADLLPLITKGKKSKPYAMAKRETNKLPESGPIGVADLTYAYENAVAGKDVCLIGTTIGWPADGVECTHPLDYLGSAGGGGLGAGPGIAVGAALALRDLGDKRIPVAVVGDGDYLMGVQALWAAAHEKIPLLIIVGNNRSYFNDELHQERVAKQRGRPPERRWIGQRIDDPAPDLAAMARAQGLEGEGPITDMADLPAALEKGLERAAAGASYVVDVLVTPEYVTSSIHDRGK
ncbi:MAG: thiamine pyrophosphate-binding protein [Proteobacteria bacterium]|nr:thiamine pyrophosphate-binding protein [Pseudomonadota bacterium]